MTKLCFKNGRFDQALQHYKTLLTYIKKAVTRNVAEKSINGILDYVSAEQKLDTTRMQEFYEVTMKALEDAKNEASLQISTGVVRAPGVLIAFPDFVQRLSTKTNLKLAKLWLDRKEYGRLTKVSSLGTKQTDDVTEHFPMADAQGLARVVCADRRRHRRRQLKRYFATRSLRPRDPNVRRDGQQQEAQSQSYTKREAFLNRSHVFSCPPHAGNLRKESASQVCDSSSEDPRCHSRVWWQDVHVRE